MSKKATLEQKMAASALLERKGESVYRCKQCGREFNAYKMSHYSVATEGAKMMARNLGRATTHALAHVRREESA